MELVSRQIVEAVKLKDGKYVLCRILVIPREQYFCREQKEPYKSYRWMREEDWAAFDSAIERLVDNGFERERTELLSPLPIRLKVQRIDEADIKYCNGVLGIDLQQKGLEMAIECRIDYLATSNYPDRKMDSIPNGYKDDVDQPDKKPSQTINESFKIIKNTETNAQKFAINVNESSIYCTTSCERVKNRNLKKNIEETLILGKYNSRPKEPLSKECTWNTYCGDSEPNEEEKLGSQKRLNESDKTDVNREQETILQEEYKLSSRCSIIPINLENMNDESKETLTQEEKNEIDKRTISIDESYQEANESSPQHSLTRQNLMDQNFKETGEHSIKSEEQVSNQHSVSEELSPQSTRRSARTLKKPKRYGEDFVWTNKRSKRSESCESSSKTYPRGISISNDASKTLNPLSKPNTPKACNKVLFQSIFSVVKCKQPPKKKEDPMEELMREWAQSSRIEKSLLTLNDMTAEKVMATLEIYKPRLDVLFSKLYNKDFITHHEGIDHYLVMRLIPNDIQKIMMERLSELYEKETTPKYGSHFINALMPEWILGILADRCEMSRDKTIALVKEQNAYLREMFSKVKEENIS